MVVLFRSLGVCRVLVLGAGPDQYSRKMTSGRWFQELSVGISRAGKPDKVERVVVEIVLLHGRLKI